MATTIDHLRADFAVRVLRDFTDVRGGSHRAGESGIIRQMGVDWTRQEIWIDWEQNGALARLHFGLAAKTGPGNGRMREYFELGEMDPALARPLPAPMPPPPPPPRPRGIKYAGKHPPAEAQLGEVAVACDCDSALHRAVLIESVGVNACLRCGTVTCSRSIGDDGRFTGDAWQVYLAVAVSERVLDWLARWPRITIRRPLVPRWSMNDDHWSREVIYLPADARCETAAELTALEEQLAGRLRESDFPTAEPPADLPPSLRAFAEFWSARQLTPTSDLAQLMSAAQLHCPGSAIAVGQLLRRPDVYDVMVKGLRSRDVVWFRGGVALARAVRPVDSRLAGVLIEIMNGLPLEPMPDGPGRLASRGWFEALLVVIAGLKLATPDMLTALQSLQRRLVRHDADLASSIGGTLRDLHGEPPPTHRGPYLP